MPKKNRYFPLSAAILLLGVCFFSCASEGATKDDLLTEKRKKVRFNTAFITDFNKDIDLSWLEEGERVKAGTYRVALYVNDKKIKNYQTTFVKEAGEVVPCIPHEVFTHLTLDEKKLQHKWQEKQCINIVKMMKGATATYDYDSETLRLTIPQIYFLHGLEDFIPPSRWDEGIDAMSLHYSLSSSNSLSRYGNYSSWYADLKTMLRLGAWRLTTLDTVSGGNHNPGRLQHLQSYAQRAIGANLSELTVGDFNTSGSLFDTVPLRGMVLQSDERMLPWIMKGYAPQIRGVADSNAVITIKQNNNTIYERNIPAGEFNITDLNMPGYGGDLDVTIRESNGAIKTFSVPYSSLPQLVRKDRFSWSVASGKIRRYDYPNAPEILESTLRYGLTNNLTIFGGSQLTFDNTYLGISSGAAFNTPLGAVSIEVYHSDSPGQTNRQRSLKDTTKIKVSAAKQLSETQTFLNVSGYHHTGENYYTLDDFLTLQQAGRGRQREINRYRDRLEVSLSQYLAPEWGELSLTGAWEKNNNNPANQSRSSWIVGYRNSYEFINYSLNFSKTLTALGKEQSNFYAALSVPLGYTKSFPPTVLASLAYTSDQANLRTSVNGSHQGQNYTSNFNSYFNQSSKRVPEFGINVGHTDSYLQKSLSYSKSIISDSFGVNLSGAALIHDEGINFFSYLGDTIGLIKAPGGEGASIGNTMNSRVRADGYGVIPNLTPYEENRIILDAKGAPLGFEINDEDEPILVPTAGAVVRAEYQYFRKNTVLGRIKGTSGNPLPFGTKIYDENDSLLGTVGQAGIVLVVLPDSYRPIKARWYADKKPRMCIIQSWVRNNNIKVKSGINSISLMCKEKDQGNG